MSCGLPSFGNATEAPSCVVNSHPTIQSEMSAVVDRMIALIEVIQCSRGSRHTGRASIHRAHEAPVPFGILIIPLAFADRSAVEQAPEFLASSRICLSVAAGLQRELNPTGLINSVGWHQCHQNQPARPHLSPASSRCMPLRCGILSRIGSRSRFRLQ